MKLNGVQPLVICYNNRLLSLARFCAPWRYGGSNMAYNGKNSEILAKMARTHDSISPWPRCESFQPKVLYTHGTQIPIYATCQPSWSPLAIFPLGGKMTHRWGRMATYPKLGDSQLSLQEERPRGERPHSMRAYVPSPNRPYPWSSGARNLGDVIRGRRGLWHSEQNGQN